MKKYIFLLGFLFMQNCFAEQFIYPIADLEEGNQLLLLYQKSLDNIELWVWNAFDKSAQKGLLSFYSPANLRLLPNKDGFSFIDQGRIRIKKFQKRSPKTIDIYEPISSITSMSWIDNHNFYFVAREGDFYQVFQSDDEGKVHRVTKEDAVDFLYPQKVDNNLFAIRRDIDRKFEVIRQDWKLEQFNFRKEIKDYATLLKNNKPICFLNMISDHEGFFLEYSGFRLENETTYNFSCYRMVDEGEEWKKSYLFTFKIPVENISGFSSARLYESVEPFLPNYTCRDFVFFVDYSENAKSFGLYKYHIPSKKTIVVNQPVHNKSGKNNQMFAPLIVNEKIHCGLMFKSGKSLDIINQNVVDGQMEFDLPSFDID